MDKQGQTMTLNTYTTDNYTYMCDTLCCDAEWHENVVVSITIGNRIFNRLDLLNIIGDTNQHSIKYPFTSKDIDKIVAVLTLARLNGAL